MKSLKICKESALVHSKCRRLIKGTVSNSDDSGINCPFFWYQLRLSLKRSVKCCCCWN